MSQVDRLRIFDPSGRDISDEIELANPRALLGGWSQQEVHLYGARIGWIECGAPMDFSPGYTFTIEPITDA